VFAGILQLVAAPRYYSHPKILLYPVLFLVGWAYIRRPDTKRLVVLGAFVAVAFLVRHDHGVYAAAAAAAAVALAHYQRGGAAVVRSIAALAAVALIGVAPYLAYVQYERGLVSYFRVGIAISQHEANRANLKLPELQPVRGGPLLTTVPRSKETLAPIAVRWRDGLSDYERRKDEQRLDLRYGERRDDGRSWRYWVNPLSSGTLASLVKLPDVVDTDGFDRSSLTFNDAPPVVDRIAGALAIDRLEPGVLLADLLSHTNATALLFYVVWLLPLAGLAVWIGRRNTCTAPLECGPAVLLLVVITAITAVTLAREPVAARVKDAFGCAPILLAWALASGWQAARGPAWPRAVARTLLTVSAILMLVCAAVMGELDQHLTRRTLLSPAAMSARIREVVEQTRVWPWRRAWPQGEGIALVPYLNRCTTDGDRLLVTWNAPEFNVFSRRPFAGSETLLIPVFRPPDTYESTVLSRLEQQRVPIVLSDSEHAAEFARAYPKISAYLSERYREAGVVKFPGGQRISVLADRMRTPASTDREFNLPCFSGA